MEWNVDEANAEMAEAEARWSDLVREGPDGLEYCDTAWACGVTRSGDDEEHHHAVDDLGSVRAFGECSISTEFRSLPGSMPTVEVRITIR